MRTKWQHRKGSARAKFQRSALYLAPRDDLAVLVNYSDEGLLLAVYGEPNRTEPVRELLAVTPGCVIGWEIEAARVLDLATVNDVEMVGRHHSSKRSHVSPVPRERAAQMRALADDMADLVTKATMLEIAERLSRTGPT